jgi:hypothetical protein
MPIKPAKSWAVKLVSSVCLCALFSTSLFSVASAQVSPPLGTAENFAVLGSSTVTNTGPTIVTGDLGVSPGTAITGFPPGIVVGGAIHAADAVAGQAQTDTTTAYNNLAGQACDFTLTGQDLGGMTLVPGVYCFSSSAQLTGALTLDAGGDPDAAWVFQIGSTLTTASNASVLLVNGARACNVFWQIGSSATLGTGTSFVGSILALASITLTTDVDVFGRALAQNGAVTMDSNTVSVSACGVPPVDPIPPTLGKAFSPATINAGGLSSLTITLTNPDDTAATLTAPLVDTLPSGVLISSPPSTTCSGTLTSDASSVTLTGGSIPANGSCTVTVPVTAASGGNYLNSLPAGALQTSNGSNILPAVSTLTVVESPATAPSIGKAFSPAEITAGGISTVRITLTNSDDTIALLTAPFTDTLPSGVQVASIPAAGTTCGGTLTAPAGGTSVTLTGGSIPANGSCIVRFNVIALASGSYFNSIPAGALQSSNGSNASPAVATLIVHPKAIVKPPKLSKSFKPATIKAGAISLLTITLSNPNSTAAKMTAPLIDYLPAGVQIASSPHASTTCGGTVTAPAGGTKVTLTGGSIPANSTAVTRPGDSTPATGSCTVTVKVTAKHKGSYYNKLPAGALQTKQGSNSSAATATLTVTR